jgi:hypothetical protein
LVALAFDQSERTGAKDLVFEKIAREVAGGASRSRVFIEALVVDEDPHRDTTTRVT